MRSLLLARMAVLAALAIPVGALAQAPRPGWDAIVAAAKKEGKVVFYSAQPSPLIERLAEGFRKAHPDIAIEYWRGLSGQLLAKVDQERISGADGADVFIHSEVAWAVANARQGRILKPVGPSMQQWPARSLQEGVVVIAGLEPFVIPYNKTLAVPPPKGYADLLRPEYKGKISTSTLNATANVAWYEWLEKTQGADFLVRLKAQNPRLHTGSVPAAQAAAAGEITLAALGLPSSAKPLMEQGAPIDYVVPNPAFGTQYTVGGVGWSRRPNAALVLVDFLMSREGQTIWHGRGETASPLPGIPGSLSASSIQPYDPAAYPPEAVAKYRDRWERIMK